MRMPHTCGRQRGVCGRPVRIRTAESALLTAADLSLELAEGLLDRRYSKTGLRLEACVEPRRTPQDNVDASEF